MNFIDFSCQTKSSLFWYCLCEPLGALFEDLCHYALVELYSRQGHRYLHQRYATLRNN